MSITAIKELGKKWPSNVVARTEISQFSGGLIKERYLANLDSAGLGPKGRFRVGRKIGYPVTEVIKFLESRFETVE